MQVTVAALFHLFLSFSKADTESSAEEGEDSVFVFSILQGCRDLLRDRRYEDAQNATRKED